MSEVTTTQTTAAPQTGGAEMPAVNPQTQSGSLDDMRAHFAAKNAEARSNPQAARGPQTAGSRMGQFSQQLEQQQQRVAQDPRGEPQQADPQQQTQGEEQGDPSQAQAEPESAEELLETAQAAALGDAEALAKFREWESSDMFPEEFLGRMHELKIDGTTHYVDGKELRQGYMRGGSSRKMYAEGKQAVQREQQYRQQVDQHFKSVRDPAMMLQMYEQNGYGDTIYQMAKLVAQRDQQDREHIHGAMLAAMNRLGINDANHHEVQAARTRAQQNIQAMRQANIERQRFEFERQNFQRQQQQQQHTQQTEQWRQTWDRQLGQLRPLAFTALGIKDTPGNRRAFGRHLADVIEQGGLQNNSMSREQCIEAAQSLRDEIQQTMQRERAGGGQQQQAPAGRQPVGPNRMGLGSGKPMGGQGAQRQSGTVDDMAKALRDKTLGRR